MSSEKIHISFPLADGSTGGICADAACAWIVKILQETHKMRPVPGERLLLNISELTPEKNLELFSGSQVIQAALPVNGVSQAAVGAEPDSNDHRIFLTRRVMFLALLPLLQKQDLFLFHGGLTVDSNGKGCLLCGPSGVGKSTAVNKAGKIWEILADDLIYLSFKNGRCFAQPGPTWSSYLLEKERPVDCDINRIVEVKNTVILSRIGEIGLKKLSPMQTSLMIANSFIEMTTWTAGYLRLPELSTELRKLAFDGVTHLTECTSCHCLTSELATDLTPYLRSIE